MLNCLVVAAATLFEAGSAVKTTRGIDMVLCTMPMEVKSHQACLLASPGQQVVTCQSA